MSEYVALKPLDKVQPGDEFTWQALAEQAETQAKPVDWYPCETFIGSRIENLTKRANLLFRRPAHLA